MPRGYLPRWGLLWATLLLLGGCESDNEHFCARYAYVYNQLQDESLPSYAEMRARLFQDLKNPDKKKEQVQFMLFILEEWNNGIKPEGEDPREFCMRTQRWSGYPYGDGE